MAGEAARRLELYGSNSLPPPPVRSALRRFLSQFENFLLQILLGAVVIMAAIGHYTDAGVILAVVLVNALMGFVQEGKAEHAIRAIQQMLTPQATVLRGGARFTVPAETLVPGDLVLVESGDRVPADVRLLRVKNLQIEEAALTGESVPVPKHPDPVGDGASLGDRSSMAFSGTLVTYGQARGIVVATGLETQIGRISSMLSDVEPLETPLLRHMTFFARTLTFAILSIAAAIFAFGVLVRDQPPTELFLAVVTLAVAAIPEALPAVMTIAMAIGVQRMAKRRALIRRLPAVETLGSVSVICSDKTGTLTRNEMTVGTLATADYRLEVSGAGYAPRGGFSLAGREFLPESNSVVMEAVRTAALCNDAGLRRAGDTWVVDGDPMEGALLTLARKAGLDPDRVRNEFPRLDIIPFESEQSFMATLHHDHSGHAFICVKGAPERILDMCRFERTTDGERPIEPASWLERIDGMASKGQRILAAAVRQVRPEDRELRLDDVASGLTMLGLYGIIDPPRDEAIAAVAECRAAGIRVKMITGDHAVTARAIAGQLGFDNTLEALTGPEIETLTDQELGERVARVDVFARASPEHKLRLVEALQARGAVVAMTGDGVNDAPALKRADVGVAMGIKGTEAAKEAAQVVLADDNFASIASAVREGRTVYDNLKKTIIFFLPINGGESLSIVVAILIGLTLPITPLQVLWINMVSSLCLALALAFEPTEPDTMSRPPRSPNDPILSRFLVWRIVFASTLFLVGIFGIFEWALSQGAEIEKARTLAVNTLVVMEVFYLFSVRFLRTPSLTLRGFIGTPVVLASVTAVVVLQLLFTYAPFMERFFDTRPISLEEGWPIIMAGVLLFIVLEIEKAIRFRWERRAVAAISSRAQGSVDLA
jgi:magnesium-transporting ATPase (P-type)